MKAIIPALPVIDIGKAVTFYNTKLGFGCSYQDDGFAKLIRDSVEIHLWAACDDRWKLRSLLLFLWPIKSGAETFIAGTASCRIEVDNIDLIYLEFKNVNVIYNKKTVVETTAWNTKEFPALDLHRNLLTFFERIPKV